MSGGANISTVLLIIAGVMAATALFVVVLVFSARFFDWLNILAERYVGLSITCGHCGAPLSFEENKCKSCGKPISQTRLKTYKLRMLIVSSFLLIPSVLIMGNILFAFILFLLGLAFWGYERHYTRTVRDLKDPRERA